MGSKKPLDGDPSPRYAHPMKISPAKARKRNAPKDPFRLTIEPTQKQGATHGPVAIEYAFHTTPFGLTLIATTTRGICFVAFPKTEAIGFASLKKRFPRASLGQRANPQQTALLRIFSKKLAKPLDLSLDLTGTPFQLAVWKALLRIPKGRLSTYGRLAALVKRPQAFRAVGTAVGQNPIAFLIPCHRVIPADGSLGNYHWGTACKATILTWEGVDLGEVTLEKTGKK